MLSQDAGTVCAHHQQQLQHLQQQQSLLLLPIRSCRWLFYLNEPLLGNRSCTRENAAAALAMQQQCSSNGESARTAAVAPEVFAQEL